MSLCGWFEPFPGSDVADGGIAFDSILLGKDNFLGNHRAYSAIRVVRSSERDPIRIVQRGVAHFGALED